MLFCCCFGRQYSLQPCYRLFNFVVLQLSSTSTCTFGRQTPKSFAPGIHLARVRCSKNCHINCMTAEWTKVLWKKQPFPDNYRPRSFLSALQKNGDVVPLPKKARKANLHCTANFEPYSYWELVWASCPVTEHLSIILIFLATFIRLLDKSWNPRLLVWISILLFLAGYSLQELLEYLQTERRSLRDRKLVITYSKMFSYLSTRRKDVKVLHNRISGLVSAIAHFRYPYCSDVVRLHLGTVCLSICAQSAAFRLWLF